MTDKEKLKLINDYMSKCPFIEIYDLRHIDKKIASIDVIFDEEYEIAQGGNNE